MSCGCSNTSLDTCGCPIQLGTQCVYYKSTTLDCLSATSGTSLEVILQNINDIICTLNPSGVMTYVVESGDTDYLTVGTSVSGNETTYTINLSSSFLTNISNINTSITNINTVLDDLPITLDTDTPSDIEILHTIPNEWRINYVGSSVPTTLSGVIYANNTQTTRPVGAILATTKSFLANYLTTYNLAIGDVIKVRTSFQLPTIKDFGAGGKCMITLSSGFSQEASNDGQDTETYSFLIDMDINVIALSGSNNALITCQIYKNLGESATNYTPNNSTSPVNQHIAHTYSYYDTINFATLEILARCTGSSSVVEARNDLFRIELLKKI
ncbi:MAG: hypothetical protein E6R13_04835 [Spirochaetes bacterium]|nr:MAG: hypothetical protein E6R13_04835 [Spirochaetota bacterium]